MQRCFLFCRNGDSTLNAFIFYFLAISYPFANIYVCNVHLYYIWIEIYIQFLALSMSVNHFAFLRLRFNLLDIYHRNLCYICHLFMCLFHLRYDIYLLVLLPLLLLFVFFSSIRQLPDCKFRSEKKMPIWLHWIGMELQYSNECEI